MRGCAAFLPGCFIRAAPPLRYDLLRQTIGQHAAGELGGPEIAREFHHGVLGSLTLDVVDQGQSRLACCRPEVDCDRVASATDKPRLLCGDLTQSLKAQIAQVTDDEVARPQGWDNRCGMSWIGSPPIGHDEVMPPRVE